jgi:hypothetical protein
MLSISNQQSRRNIKEKNRMSKNFTELSANEKDTVTGGGNGPVSKALRTIGNILIRWSNT